ncbi:MAG: transglutaminaseTgpA domain-containing protein [Acidimicrobiia bacterium]|nr:transglutaminaseTgpA domain-containing protein [Acidimicrobiia bacterium]
MVYRFSWLAGVAAIVFALTGLNGLLRPTTDGTRWQFIVIAALVLGATITWTALSYRAHPIIVVVLNLAALVVAVSRIAAPETTNGLLPTGETWTAVAEQLDRAIALIRTGIEPVQPIAGIVIVLAAVFWVVGVLLTWGLMRGHPYVALIPPLVLSLQFATMDRGRTSPLRMLLFLAVVAASIVAVTIDERDQSAGRMAGASSRPTLANRLAPAAAGLLGATLLLSVFTTGFMAGMVPYDGVLPWRSATGLTSDFYGGVAYNPFIGIQQSLVSQSSTPVFLAEITGEVPADQVYFRLVTMETYNGGQFFADKPRVVDLETRPWEDGGNAFDGPTGLVTTTIQIERLRMDWLPETYVPFSFSSPEDIEDQIRVRQADGTIRLEGNVSYEDMIYTIESAVPLPDIAVLATGEDGELSPAFEFAATEQDVPDPVVAPFREEPSNPEQYLDLPEDIDPGIEDEARRLTENLDTNYEIGLALESWFHSPAFRYSTDIDPGHGATDLADWLLDPDSNNYRIGYCENFATAMAVMARTLDVPSRVVLGFTPGEPTDQENVYVVRDRNAHAWVELWIPTQGWVRFDPTPRSDGINPSTFGNAENDLGFDLTSYLEVPDPEPLDVQTAPLPLPRFGEDEPIPGFIGAGGGADEAGGGLSVPTWVKAVAPIAILLILIIGGIPTVKWWQRTRRMKRLRNGDISAAWEDIVARLTDLGESPSPAATPREIADSVDDAMVPLAIVYGRSVYGPTDAVAERHVNTAIESLDQTRARLMTRHSVAQRFVAAYRPASVIPDGVRRATRRLRFNGNGNRSNGS